MTLIASFIPIVKESATGKYFQGLRKTNASEILDLGALGPAHGNGLADTVCRELARRHKYSLSRQHAPCRSLLLRIKSP